jgi:catechol 2,3-dioxygenase-like lactoylglutathione lyase family enzyme
MEDHKPILAVISLWAEDIEKEVHFYKDVLGFKLFAHSGPRPHFDLGGTYLTIIEEKNKVDKKDKRQDFPLFAFRVDNLEKYINILNSHGLATPFGIEKDSESRWIKIIDPAGNLIELVESDQI